MVEEIEEFGTELNYREFADPGVLDQREVDVLVTRPIQDVTARIAEAAERRDGEGRRVEPALRRRVIQLGLPRQVRTVVAQKPEVRDAGDRKSTRLNSSHVRISYAVFCLKK